MKGYISDVHAFQACEEEGAKKRWGGKKGGRKGRINIENPGTRTSRSIKCRLEIKEMSLLITAVRSPDENGKLQKSLLTLQNRT